MDEYQLQFIEHEDEGRNLASDIFHKIYQTEEKKQKEATVQFLAKINQNLLSPQSSPRSKFMTLLILRDVLQSCLKPETKFNKLFSSFLSHKLLDTIEGFCQSIDPNKVMQDKGRKHFQGEGELGHNFVRCNLQLLKMLAAKFPKGKNEDATAFKKKYNKLVEQKVTFPNQYKFITLQLGSKVSKEEGMVDTKRSYRNSGSAEPIKESKANSKQKDLLYLEGKVKLLLQCLEDGDDEEYTQTQIVKLHELVLADDQKFINTLNELFEKGEGEEIINRYLNANQFITVEKQTFEKNINRTRNIPAYSRDIKQAASSYFPDGVMPTPGKSNIKMTQSKQYEQPQPNRFQKQEEKPKQSKYNPGIVNNLASYFQQVENKSKSPIGGGFRKINQSLSREKAKNNTLRSRVSPHNKSNISKSINSLKGSKVAAIFANPPNPNPPQRYYEGNEISENFVIEDIIKNIDKSQGHRRFCTSNFKGKGSIFENQHVQIGFKSEAVYEEVSGFRVLLKIELYFGNLSEETFRNLSLNFKGDDSILLYANPREIQKSARKGEQNRIDLVIIPLKPQFPLIKMKTRYEAAGEQHEHIIILPNTVLKFVHFMEISKSQFVSQWESMSLFKSTEFNLSHHLPPDSLIRWIPSLSELSPYNEFVVPGSRVDYELFTTLILMQRYEALLRVTVRPNLKVVLQLGLDEKNEEAVGYFMTFLQHLQQLMKEFK